MFRELSHVHGITETWRPLLGPVSAAVLDGHLPSANALSFLDDSRRRVLQAAFLMCRDEPVGAVPPGAPGTATAALDQLAARIAALVRVAVAVAADDADLPLPVIIDDGRTILLNLPTTQRAARTTARVRTQCESWNSLMIRPITPTGGGEIKDAPGLLQPSVGMAEAGRRILCRQLEHFLVRAYGLGYPGDREFVHEARVATRRMRAVLRVFKAAFATDMDTHVVWLSRVADVLGEARDSDVFLSFMRTYAIQAKPSHLPFIERTVAREGTLGRQRYERLAKVIGTARHQRAVKTFYNCVSQPLGSPNGLSATADPGQRPLSAVAAGILHKPLKRVWRFDGSLKRCGPEELHRLRILFKKTRYPAEFLAAVYPDRLAGLLRPALAMHRLLGDVHDVDVYLARIRHQHAEEGDRQPDGAGDEACEALCSCLAERRQRRLRKANRIWQEFISAKSRRRILRRLSSD